MEECRADQFLVKYQEEKTEEELKKVIENSLLARLNANNNWKPDLKALDKYSAKESARKLVNAIEYVLIDPETHEINSGRASSG